MDHLDNTLRAAVKALDDVVAPALDPGDQQAALQLRLVVDALEFVRERVDFVDARARFDLDHHVALAAAVGDDARACSVELAAELDRAVAAAHALRTRSDAAVAELRDVGAGVAAALRALVRAASEPGVDAALRRRIERHVIDGSRTRIALDRAWHAPLGFEADPARIPTLAEALRADAGSPT